MIKVQVGKTEYDLEVKDAALIEAVLLLTIQIKRVADGRNVIN